MGHTAESHPLVGGAPKSAPKSSPLSLPPWRLREQTPTSPTSTLELVDRDEGSSMSSGLDVDPKSRPVFHPAKVGGPPLPEVGEEVTPADLWVSDPEHDPEFQDDIIKNILVCLAKEIFLHRITWIAS